MSRGAMLFPRPQRTPMVAASILSADFATMGAECRAVLDAGADLLHLDVMDGHFVPNLTMGPAMCASLRKAFPDVFLDVHLMVTDPSIYIEPFAAAGADLLSFHIEAAPDPAPIAEAIHAAGMRTGLAMNPPTNMEVMLEKLDPFDLILVMSVNPGFAGQPFISSVLAKADQLRPRLRDDQRLEIDGGVNAQTAAACRESGFDVLVAASAIFKSGDYAGAIEAIRGGAIEHHPAQGIARQGPGVRC